MNNALLNSKELEYKILLKDIKGINPKVSTYTILEEKIEKLRKELCYTTAKVIKKPHWNKHVSVLHYKHKIKVGSDSRTNGAVFDTKRKMGKMNSQNL